MRHPGLGAGLWLLAWVALGHALPPPRVVLRSGTLAAGLGLASFREPRQAGEGRLAFRATTDLLTVPDGDGARTLIATGASLPAPDHGTINTFSSWFMRDDLVAFDADLNGPDVDHGLFVIDGGELVTVATRRTSLDTERLSPFEINGAGTIAYAAEAGVYRWSRSTRASERVAADTAVVRNPAIDESGAVAWATATGVLHWSEASGVRTVASRDGPSPFGGAAYVGFARSAVDVDATTGVAFLAETGSGEGAFLWNPATGVTTLVLKEGQSVEGDPIARFERRIWVYGDGSVVAFARVGRRRRYVRVVDGLVELTARPRSDTGLVEHTTRDGLYVLDGETVRIVARQGDAVDGVGLVSRIGPFRTTGRTIVFGVDTDDDRTTLVSSRRGRLSRVVGTGDVLPGLGTVSSVVPFAISGDAVVFFDGEDVVRLEAGSRPTAIRRPQTVSPDAYLDVGDLYSSGSVVTMLATTYDPSGGGIYVASGDRFVPFLEVGDVIPGSHGARLSSVGSLDVRAGRRLFGAYLVGDELGLFLAIGRRIVRLSTELAGDPPSTVGADMPTLAGQIAVVGGYDALYVATRRGARSIVEPFEVTEVGTLSFYVRDPLEDDKTFTVADEDVVFAATITGGESRAALLARKIRAPAD